MSHHGLPNHVNKTTSSSNLNERNSGTTTTAIICSGSKQWMTTTSEPTSVANKSSASSTATNNVQIGHTTTSMNSTNTGGGNGTVAHHHHIIERSTATTTNGNGNSSTTTIATSTAHNNKTEPCVLVSSNGSNNINNPLTHQDYTGIFLVDGVNQGVLLNGDPCNPQGEPNQHPSLFQYGLPNPEEGLSPGSSNSTTTMNNPSPVCIRIDPLVSSPQPIVNDGELQSSVPIMQQLTTATSVTTLPVPSPVVNITTTDIISAGGSSSSPSTSPSRNLLISTEAQTEDLPALAPPPPPQRNREHRKRDRREHRRDRHRNNNGRSSSSVTDASSSRPHRSSRSKAMRTSSAGSVVVSTGEERSSNSTPGGASSSVVSTNGTPHNNRSSGSNTNNSPHYHTTTDGLPDLLNAHSLPPPYSTLPQDPRRMGIVGGNVPLPPPPPNILPPPPILSHHPPSLMSGNGAPPPPPHPPNCIPPSVQPVRYHFPPVARTSRRSIRAPRGLPYTSEEEPKSCCGMSPTQAVSIRWFIVAVAVIGICCTVAGTTLGAVRPGKEHVTLSLLMIGVGVVLLTVSALAWRLTANEGGTSCRGMLGFGRHGSGRGDGGSEPNRRFIPRLAPSFGRPHHPYAAMLYPEFQYRPPPPTYQQSMQEYRLRLLLLERSNPTIAAAAAMSSPNGQMIMPPPPIYRPFSVRPAHGVMHEYFTPPPSYRSRSSALGILPGEGSPNERLPSSHPGAITPQHHLHHQHHHHTQSPLHSRDPSLLSYLSQQSLGDNVSIVSGHTTGTGTQGTTTATVVTVVQAVPVGMELGMTYDPVTGEEKPVVLSDPMNSDDMGEEKVGYEDEEELGGHEKSSKDGNMVRIVQTTDSSQVIGRDSVIVTVSGSNQDLWDPGLQPAQQTSHHNHHQSQQCPTGEVQILAHL